jgi:DMSO reductase family type II enzyme chaperone
MLEHLTNPEEILAAERSRAWRLFNEAFIYPDEAHVEAIRSGELAAALRDVLRATYPALLEEVEWDALRDAGEGDDLAVEYTRLFDVGTSGPPCPLYGGLYGGARMRTMEEAVRFYNHFDLKLSDDPRELPDHLGTQLEFLHYLAFREAEALHRGSDPGPYRRAQRDFVARHPGAWVPRLRQRLEEQQPAAYFRSLVELLDRVLAAECARLALEAGPAPEN